MSEPSHESASSPPSGAREFHLPMLIPEGIRYNCQGCGRCCSGWPVGLTEKDYARVKDVDWGSLHPELAGKELFRHRDKEFAGGDSLYPHYTTAREDGGCSFLIDNLCFIHGTLGEDSKPSMCKLFPYTFTVTPSGIYVGLVYGSMAAVRNLGNLLSEQRPMLERMWQVQVEYERSQGHVPDAVVRAASSLTAESLSAVEFKINLTAGIPLAWQEYLAVEEALTSVIHCEGHADFTRALLACSRLLSEALRLKSSGGDLRQLKELQPALSAALPAGSAAARATVAEELLFRALYFKSFEWPKIRRRIADHRGAARKNPLTDPQVVGHVLAAVLLGRVETTAGRKVSLAGARRLRVKRLSPEMTAFFKRYFYLKLFSKTFAGPALSGLSVVSGFNNLVGNFLCAVTFAKIQALLRGDQELRIADLYEAHVLIDREVVMLNQLSSEKRSFYDLGFSSPRLFDRLVAEVAAGFSI